MSKINEYGKALNRLLENQSSTESDTLNKELALGQPDKLQSWALVDRDSDETTELDDLSGGIVKEHPAFDQPSTIPQILSSAPIACLKSESSDATRHGGRFPPEIWCCIIESAATVSEEYAHSDAAGYASGKVKMQIIHNLSSLSKFHRRVVLEYWARTLHLLEQRDMMRLQSIMELNCIDILRYVRRLVCEDTYEVYKAPRAALDAFHFLDELVLVCHRDINFGSAAVQMNSDDGTAHIYNGNQAQQGAPEHHPDDLNGANEQAGTQPRMSYRKLLVRLPSTLRALKVYASHVPDIYFIQKVADECPLLRSLTLARCTIFTCAQCRFWKQLPRTESDAYFSDQGTAAYASALGKEIRRLKNLEEISIGIYLTDHAAIDVHLAKHAGLNVSSENDLTVWEQPCHLCIRQYQEATLQLEREATAILAKENTKLLKVSWASFCSNRRTGWSSHEVLREKGEPQELSVPIVSAN